MKYTMLICWVLTYFATQVNCSVYATDNMYVARELEIRIQNLLWVIFSKMLGCFMNLVVKAIVIQSDFFHSCRMFLKLLGNYHQAV